MKSWVGRVGRRPCTRGTAGGDRVGAKRCAARMIEGSGDMVRGILARAGGRAAATIDVPTGVELTPESRCCVTACMAV
jgi:hypothetical protein